MTNSEEIKFIEPKDYEAGKVYLCLDGRPFQEIEKGKAGDTVSIPQNLKRLGSITIMEFTDKEVPSKGFTSFSDAPPEIDLAAIKEGMNTSLLNSISERVRERWRNGEGITDQTNPNYYTLPNGIQAKDVTGHFDGNTAQAIQYLWRHGKKAGNDPILELEKAKTFIDFRIEHIKKFGV